MSVIFSYDEWVDICNRGTSGDQVMDILASWKVSAYNHLENIHKLQAEIDRLNAELLELNDKAVFIKFENEDELPAEIKDDVYSAMFECSHVDGVRLFPYIEENGQKYFLVMLKEVV